MVKTNLFNFTSAKHTYKSKLIAPIAKSRQEFVNFTAIKLNTGDQEVIIGYVNFT